MNGEETSIKREKKGNEWDETYLEQAATVDKSLNNNEISEFEKVSSSAPKKKKAMSQVVKTMILAAISAIVIGVALGFIMLRMFAGIDESSQQVNSYGNTTQSGAANSDEVNTGAGVSSEKKLQAYVVQGGVFSTEKKAKEWQVQFKNAGFESLIWQREGQYFLFAGISKTEQTADETAGLFSAENLETYVKPWSTKVAGVEESDQETDVLKKFLSTWNNTLENINSSDHPSLNKEEWEKWIASIPEESKKELQPLTEQATKLIQVLNEGENMDENQLQISLLKLWKGFESYLLSD